MEWNWRTMSGIRLVLHKITLPIVHLAAAVFLIICFSGCAADASYRSLGLEEEGANSILVVNSVGSPIKSLETVSGGDGLARSYLIGKEPIDVDETVRVYLEGNGPFDFYAGIADGANLAFEGIDLSGVESISLVYEDGIAYVNLVDFNGNEVSTRDAVVARAEDEAAAFECVSVGIEQMKNATEENAREFFSTGVWDQLIASGANPTDIYESLFGSIEYELKGVTVEGERATVILNVTCADLQAAIQNYMSAVSSWASSKEAIDAYAKDGEDGLTRKTVSLLAQSLVDPELGTKTEEVQIALVKNEEGAWEIEDENQVMSALFANTDMENLF